MKVNELVDTLKLRVLNEGDNMNSDIKGGYTSDLLSDVMGNVGEGAIWITLQTHTNVVAVASLMEIAAIILVNDLSFDDQTLSEATKAGVTVLSSSLPSFELSAIVYNAIKNNI